MADRNQIPRVGSRQTEVVDESGQYRTTMRVVYDDMREHIYFEVSTAHGDTVVYNACRVSRDTLKHKLGGLGVL